jgi:predicted DNA binding CopG/RHH family protein
MIKQFFKKITGIQAIEDLRAEAEAAAVTAVKDAARAKAESDAAIAISIAEADKARKEEEQAKLSPKERASAQGIPYVTVLDTHVNKDNIRNGFFELDWNAEFVLQLKQAGYGFDGDPDEEIVDRWFRQLCTDVAGQEGVDMSERGAGYINVKKIAEGKSEVS